MLTNSKRLLLLTAFFLLSIAVQIVVIHLAFRNSITFASLAMWPFYPVILFAGLLSVSVTSTFYLKNLILSFLLSGLNCFFLLGLWHYNVLFLSFNFRETLNYANHLDLSQDSIEKLREKIGVIQSEAHVTKHSFLAFPENKKTDVYRIGVFGASHAFGSEVPFGEDIVSKLNKKLSKQTKLKVEILNFSYPTYGLSQNYFLMREMIDKYKIDFIILFSFSFFSLSDLNFTYPVNSNQGIPRSRFVLEGDLLREIPAKGESYYKKVEHYYSFFPSLQYLRFGLFVPPVMMSFLGGTSQSRHQNPFYYSSDVDELKKLRAGIYRKISELSVPTIVYFGDQMWDDLDSAVGLPYLLFVKNKSYSFHQQAGWPLLTRYLHSSKFATENASNELFSALSLKDKFKAIFYNLHQINQIAFDQSNRQEVHSGGFEQFEITFEGQTLGSFCPSSTGVEAHQEDLELFLSYGKVNSNLHLVFISSEEMKNLDDDIKLIVTSKTVEREYPIKLSSTKLLYADLSREYELCHLQNCELHLELGKKTFKVANLNSNVMTHFPLFRACTLSNVLLDLPRRGKISIRDSRTNRSINFEFQKMISTQTLEYKGDLDRFSKLPFHSIQ